MITKNMIDAGKRAYIENCDKTYDDRMAAIYEAMADQKQKDALIEYRNLRDLDSLKDASDIGHSER